MHVNLTFNYNIEWFKDVEVSWVVDIFLIIVEKAGDKQK